MIIYEINVCDKNGVKSKITVESFQCGYKVLVDGEYWSTAKERSGISKIIVEIFTAYDLQIDKAA